MRFLERAIKALGYHRRPYVAGVLVTICFALLTIGLATGAQLNLTTKLNFQNRLAQFDNSAVKSANQLIKYVDAAYTDIATDYQQVWWLTLGAFILITAIFALVIAHLRRQETEAYLLVGKSSWDIVAQYVLENLVVFAAGFAIAYAIGVCLISVATTKLSDLNLSLLTTKLEGHVTASQYSALVKQLFAHRITDFSGDGLVFGHRGGPQVNAAKLYGVLRSFVSGAISLTLTQGLIFALAVWRRRRRLYKQSN